MPTLPPPVLEVYYSPTCAPCRAELPVLADFVTRDSVRVRIVILEQEERARGDIRAVSAKLETGAVANAKAPPRITLLAAGNSDGILPYARSVTVAGKVCAKWRGGLTLERARALIGACAALNEPSKRRS